MCTDFGTEATGKKIILMLLFCSKWDDWDCFNWRQRNDMVTQYYQRFPVVKRNEIKKENKTDETPPHPH
eukprot:scaffold376756_cov43-Attheya_sp.AAC.1